MVTYSKTEKTRLNILEAAKQTLLCEGFAGLSTRKVAAIAEVPMSQIQYHFGSKEGMLLALFEYMNDLLLERQNSMFADTDMSLAQKWEIACDYLDEDLASGYVRIFLELAAAGWGNKEIGKIVQSGISGWNKALTEICRKAETKYDCLGIFKAEEIAILINAAFFGAEAFLLLGMEDQGLPIRQSLRRIGASIDLMEKNS